MLATPCHSDTGGRVPSRVCTSKFKMIVTRNKGKKKREGRFKKQKYSQITGVGEQENQF